MTLRSGCRASRVIGPVWPDGCTPADLRKLTAVNGEKKREFLPYLQPLTDSQERPMSAVLSPVASTAPDAAPKTDGFHLVIDALKLNGIDTIYGLPGIP